METIRSPRHRLKRTHYAFPVFPFPLVRYKAFCACRWSVVSNIKVHTRGSNSLPKKQLLSCLKHIIGILVLFLDDAILYTQS